MEKVNFGKKLEIGLQVGLQIGLSGMVSFQTLSPLRTEAQSVAESTYQNKGQVTASFLKLPNIKCIQTAQHATLIFTEGVDLNNNITFDAKLEKEETATSIISKNSKVYYADGADLAIVCKDKVNFELYKKSIQQKYNTEQDFNKLIRKDPRIILETAVVAKLSGQNNKGEFIEVNPIQSVIPKLRKIRATGNGHYTKQINSYRGCILDFSEKDVLNMAGRNSLGAIVLEQSRYILLKNSSYYKNKFNNQNLPMIPAISSGVSGSPIRSLNELVKFGGVASMSVRNSSVATEYIKLISSSKKGKESLKLCSKLGFNMQNSELGLAAVVFKGSKFTLKPKYSMEQFLDHNKDNSKP
jgi:hypothetical protein